MNLDERLRQMLAQPRAGAGAGHGVPLVADAAGVEPQRPCRRRLGSQRRNFRRDEPRLAVIGKESALGEKAALRLQLAVTHRPLHGAHLVERLIRHRAQPADIEIAAAVVFESRQAGMFAKDVGSRAVIERRAKTQSLGDFADDPPIRPGLSGRCQKRTLARDAPFRIGHRAGFLAPGLRRQQHMRAGIDGIVGADILRDHEQFELCHRGAHDIGVRQRHHRIGAHHPQRLDFAARDRLEHLDRLQPLMGRDPRRLPEPAHAIDVRRRETHMRGELVGKAADFAAAHRVGLSGQRERRCARFSDPPRGEVAIEDGIDLVGALRRLVDALRIQRDHARRVAANIWKNSATSRSARPVASAVAAALPAMLRARATASSKPEVWRSM